VAARQRRTAAHQFAPQRIGGIAAPLHLLRCQVGRMAEPARLPPHGDDGGLEVDTLVVTRIDRLACSVKDLQDIVHGLQALGVALKATEQPIDIGTAAGKAFLDMLGVFAEFETNIRRERQREGIAAAKARGAYRGRLPTIDAGAVRRLAGQGIGGTEIARQLRISRASVYRLLEEAAGA
jgi:DNA invertase Pin-like site-specific DNA recombinase